LSALLAPVKLRTWRFLLPLSFFGLSDKYIQSVYEQIFLLKYHGGWSLIEAYNLPIKLREWFLTRLTKQLEKEAEENKKAMNSK
tara:strand:- start:468 stop:719 length:252 start_codon:yes stop_codon:yes gene_type:complete